MSPTSRDPAVNPEGSPAVATGTQDRSLIPTREHYDAEYFGYGRFFSLAHQVAEAMRVRPDTVLEVGVGSGFAAHVLRSLGVRVTTLDVEESLSPDILASVTAIPVGDAQFDVGVCCQVLEHLPFDQFEPALRELRRVVRGPLVLSLPDVSRRVHIRGDILGRVTFSWSFHMRRHADIPARRKEEMGHYWEIGYKETPFARVVESMMRAGWTIERTWRVSEMPWHRFFRMRSDSI